jgi:Pin2-interacting protein X1
LGLGATLKSQDPIHTRTGLDAFQGLLGRLNGKSDVELENEAKKSEDRKLAMWAQGRWGGVTFVPGGTLVQGDGYNKAGEEAPEVAELRQTSESQNDTAGSDDRAQRKAEKRRRKEEKRRKRDAGLDDRTSAPESTASNPKADMAQGTGSLERAGFSGEKVAPKEKKQKRRQRPALSAEDEGSITTPGEQADDPPGPSMVSAPPNPVLANRTTSALPRTGRHVIRGRNIEAKKMAFSDVKLLDQVNTFVGKPYLILMEHPDIHGQGLKQVKAYSITFPHDDKKAFEEQNYAAMFNI